MNWNAEALMALRTLIAGALAGLSRWSGTGPGVKREHRVMLARPSRTRSLSQGGAFAQQQVQAQSRLLNGVFECTLTQGISSQQPPALPVAFTNLASLFAP